MSTLADMDPRGSAAAMATTFFPLQWLPTGCDCNVSSTYPFSMTLNLLWAGVVREWREGDDIGFRGKDEDGRGVLCFQVTVEPPQPFLASIRQDRGSCALGATLLHGNVSIQMLTKPGSCRNST